MLLYSVNDPRLQKYGRVLHYYDLGTSMDALLSLNIPQQGVLYVPSEPFLEKLPLYKYLKENIFGCSDIQFGYCCGHKHQLNALEYHRSSEVNLMATDAILLLGTREKMTVDFQYNNDDIEGFYIPAGTLIEMYSNTMHYSPLSVNTKGFSIGVFLPRGTNTALPKSGKKEGEGALLTEINKWVIGYPNAKLPDSVYRGLKGKNLSLEDFENLEDWS